MRHFLSTFSNLKLTGLDSDFLELIPGIRITSSPTIREKILTDTVKFAIGYIETEYIRRSNSFVYYEYEDNEPTFKGLPQNNQLEIILLWIDDILKNSWLFKDNCITCDTAYLIDDQVPNGLGSSLQLQYKHSLSNGLIKAIEFTKQDWIDCISIHDKLETYLVNKESGSLKFMLEKNFSRVGRSLKFVKQAREARNIPYKISNYCAALETLFTTENMEISHKLSERVAFFIKDEFIKIETYKSVKKAYSIRSKLTHGASIEKKELDQLAEISFQTDKILRSAIIKIINSIDLLEIFDSSNEKIDRFFENLIFQ